MGYLIFELTKIANSKAVMNHPNFSISALNFTSTSHSLSHLGCPVYDDNHLERNVHVDTMETEKERSECLNVRIFSIQDFTFIPKEVANDTL